MAVSSTLLPSTILTDDQVDDLIVEVRQAIRETQPYDHTVKNPVLPSAEALVTSMLDRGDFPVFGVLSTHRLDAERRRLYDASCKATGATDVSFETFWDRCNIGGVLESASVDLSNEQLAFDLGVLLSVILFGSPFAEDLPLTDGLKA